MDKISQFLDKHAKSGGRPVPARLQAMLALLESLRKLPNLDLRAHLSDAGQSLTSHETLGDRAHVRLSLKPLNKNHGRRSCNLHAWGQELLNIIGASGFGSVDPDKRERILDQAQLAIACRLRAIIEEGPLRVRCQGKSADSIVAELLKQAEKKQKAGDVAQYLVGAKLAIRFNRQIPIHGANKGDRKSHSDTGARLGDFEIESSIIEVAIGLPDEKHLQQIQDIIEQTDREIWLLTREDRVAIWKNETSRRFTPQQLVRIVITSVETFVGQNITELGEFSATRKLEKLAELAAVYNTAWVDTIGVPSIRISLE